MLDFAAVRNGDKTINALTADLTIVDLRRLTHEMIDAMHDLIRECRDEDVTFVPHDPGAHDPVAATEEEIDMPWTLGHVIVHTTASAEESAAIAAELARGVTFHGRSRSEVPWQTIKTIEQCRHRLQESRRMRLASLDMWPDEPHLDNLYRRQENGPGFNAITYFTFGLSHDDSHLQQIEKIVKQAQAART